MKFDRQEFNREISARVRVARRRLGLTQVAIAGEIGIPRATYASIEVGRIRWPIDVLWRSAIVLRVPVSLLIPEPLVGRAETPIDMGGQ